MRLVWFDKPATALTNILVQLLLTSPYFGQQRTFPGRVAGLIRRWLSGFPANQTTDDFRFLTLVLVFILAIIIILLLVLLLLIIQI